MLLTKHKKQRGFDTYFLTGTDEHGVNIQRVAETNGKTPKEHVDFISGEMKKMFARIRLGQLRHFYADDRAVSLRSRAELCGGKLPEIKRRKATKRFTKAFTKAGFARIAPSLKPKTNTNCAKGEDVPRCLIHERPLDHVAEESYFFRLSDYGETLLQNHRRKSKHNSSRSATQRGRRFYQRRLAGPFDLARKKIGLAGAFPCRMMKTM